MKEIRTTFYELRSYFVPGVILLWLIVELLALHDYGPTTKVISTLSPTAKVILFIIMAYVIGHSLHVIANFTIDKLPFASYPPKNYFEGQFQKDFSPGAIDALFNASVSVLGIQNANSEGAIETIKSAYWVCFQYVMNLQNVETENFLGLTGFYRGITSAMMVATIFYIGTFFKFGKSEAGIIGVFALFMSILFLTRVKRFGNYLARTVYSNFLHLYNERKQI